MHDPRTSTALRHLAELSGDRPPSRWHWAVARMDRAGRTPLPGSARAALALRPGETNSVRARVHRTGLVLRAGSGAGHSLPVDRRGRLAIPIALRCIDGLVIGTLPDDELVVVAAVTVLDGLGDVLAGRRS